MRLWFAGPSWPSTRGCASAVGSCCTGTCGCAMACWLLYMSAVGGSLGCASELAGGTECASSTTSFNEGTFLSFTFHVLFHCGDSLLVHSSSAAERCKCERPPPPRPRGVRRRSATKCRSQGRSRRRRRLSSSCCSANAHTAWRQHPVLPPKRTCSALRRRRPIRRRCFRSHCSAAGGAHLAAGPVPTHERCRAQIATALAGIRPWAACRWHAACAEGRPRWCVVTAL